MRRLDNETLYSKRTYFFGVIAFICYLIQNGLNGVQLLTETPIPSSLLSILTVLLFIVITLCIYNAIKSINEPTTFKKIIGLILAMSSLFYIILFIT